MEFQHIEYVALNNQSETIKEYIDEMYPEATDDDGESFKYKDVTYYYDTVDIRRMIDAITVWEISKEK